MELSKQPGTILRLSLRRDRGYVYFPDAIESCLQVFECASESEIRAECYRMSNRLIRAEELPAGHPIHKKLFGLVTVNDGQTSRKFALHEEASVNFELYEFTEGYFPTLFHRWAVGCKHLYHHSDPDSGMRMLLQRIDSSARSDDAGNETIKLDFMTKDRALKFSVWQAGRQVGSVIASAKKMD